MVIEVLFPWLNDRKGQQPVSDYFNLKKKDYLKVVSA